MKLFKRKPKRLNPHHFTDRWHELQKHCATRKTWPHAIIEADKLLNEALKQARYKGRTTGERLVAAQHALTDNEAVWYSHKLSTKIGEVDVRTIKKQDMLDGLMGFRQALRDLGALES
jgi:hypothetical protein